MKLRKSLPLLVLLLTGCVSLGACNTIRGIGEDTEKAGEVIQEEAEDASEELKDDGSAAQAR